MDVANQGLGQFALRLQRFLVLSWQLLRQLRTTAVLLALLGLILCLGLWLPQPSGPEVTAAIWTKTLPPWLQGRGDLLFALGFAHLFHSFWFWLPVALLLLHSLVALADYLPPSWQRFRETPADLAWQHPLAIRTEYFTRLPALPDEFLEKLKATLQAQGFTIDPTIEENQRQVSARRWA